MPKFTRLIRYEIIDPPVYRLVNGCGEVYQAIDTLFRRPAAIKTIGEAFLAANKEQARRRFIDECKIQAYLREQCDNIVAVYDFGMTADDNLFYAMEWMEGGSADFDCGQVSEAKARVIVRQAMTALGASHRAGYVHGDVAPANLLCDGQRRIYRLGDFGMAQYLKPGASSYISSPRFSSQRVDFIPREEFNQPGLVRPSTDVFSLAATYYTLLTGEPLPRRPDGLHYVPGVIRIKHEGRQAAPRVQAFFDQFITQHRPEDTIPEFRERFERLP